MSSPTTAYKSARGWSNHFPALRIAVWNRRS
jgi:hypothetical protein